MFRNLIKVFESYIEDKICSYKIPLYLFNVYFFIVFFIIFYDAYLEILKFEIVLKTVKKVNEKKEGISLFSLSETNGNKGNIKYGLNL